MISLKVFFSTEKLANNGHGQTRTHGQTMMNDDVASNNIIRTVVKAFKRSLGLTPSLHNG